MNKISERSEFKVISSDISFSNDGIITHLYLPIIGSEAHKMYCWLKSEAILGIANNESITQNHARILKYLHLTLSQFNDLRIILESHGLLKTYYDDSNDLYIYYLIKPLDVNQFCDNLVFRNKLMEKVSKEELERSLIFLKPINLDDIFENISVELDTTYDAKNKENTVRSTNYVFDFTKLISDFLKENIVLNLSEADHNLVDAFYKTNEFSYQDILNNIKHSIINSEKNIYVLNSSLFEELMKIAKLDYDAERTINNIEDKSNDFKNKTKNMRDFNLFLDFSFDNDKKTKIFKWYDTYNFSVFYQIVTKEKPTSYITKSVNEVQKKYAFSNLLINLMVDFVIFETSKLNINYFKKLCQTINNLNLHDENQVLDHIRNFKQGNKFNKINSSNKKIKDQNLDLDKKENDTNYFNFLNE